MSYDPRAKFQTREPSKRKRRFRMLQKIAGYVPVAESAFEISNCVAEGMFAFSYVAAAKMDVETGGMHGEELLEEEDDD